MILNLLEDASLFLILQKIDVDLAEQTRKRGCPHCQGRLHYAPYQRKPRGGPEGLPDEICKRLSLCCAKCRRRVLPPSVLFFGRRVYWRVVIIVVIALRQQRVDSTIARRLKARFGITSSTLWRWMEYFRSAFLKSPIWQNIRGRLRQDETEDLPAPASILKALCPRGEASIEALVRCMRIFLPPDFSNNFTEL